MINTIQYHKNSGPSLQWAEFAVGRVCSGPTLKWAEMSIKRIHKGHYLANIHNGGVNKEPYVAYVHSGGVHKTTFRHCVHSGGVNILCQIIFILCDSIEFRHEMN